MPQKSLAALLVLVAALLAGCHSAGPKIAQTEAGQTPETKPQTQAHAPTIAIAAMDRRIPVLMFHDVIERRGPGSVWFDTTLTELKQQFDWLARHEITPISLDQLYAHLTTGAEVPKDSIVLTFDDNGEGFYQFVVPLLRQYKFPAAMFVHTASPTMDKPGRPHMTWDQLRELTKDPLITIGAHSINHPEDMRQLSEAAATQEIAGCKTELEKQLGIPVNYFAYPNGKYNNALEKLTQDAGFKMAFTIESGLAEQSANLYAIHRFERQKLPKAWEDRDKASLDAPAAVARVAIQNGPVKVQVGVYEGLKIAFVQGGLASTVLSKAGRQGVTDFVQQAGGAAGINGGFFAMAGLQSTSNVMIGPSMTASEAKFLPDPGAQPGSPLTEKLRNRPIIFWGPKDLAIVPYQPETMNSEAVFRDFMPDFTDLFLAGAWIVHEGVARGDEQLAAFASKDVVDPRRRAFLGVSRDGQIVIGASLQTCSTSRLAEAAAAAGVQEAVLLDSGFSTSLVYNGRIVVTGHTARNLPSRPVPHAIVISGQLDLNGAETMLASAAEGARSPADIEGEQRARERRRQARLEAERRAQMAAELSPNGPTTDRPGVTVITDDDAGGTAPPVVIPPGDPNKPDPTKPDPNNPDPKKPDPKKPEPKKPDSGTPKPGDPKKPDPKDPGKPGP